MKVLVTGCAGYVGSVLCEHLLSHSFFQVVGVDNLMHDNGTALAGFFGHPDFDFHRMDVRDDEGLLRVARDCDAVVHLAALVGAPLCQRFPVKTELVNHGSARTLSRGLSREQRLVYPNTNSGYGKGDGARPVTEDDPLRPLSRYASTKCAGEEEVLDHPMGVSFRLATVFGVSPRMRFDLLVNDFTDNLAELVSLSKRPGPPAYAPMVLFEPHFMRNYVHVRDVARALTYALVNHNLKGPYNLGHPDANLSKRALALRVLGCLGIDEDTDRFVTFGDGNDPDQRDYAVSNKRVLDTGFTFQHSLAYGIREVAAYRSLLTRADVRLMRNA